MFLPFLPFLVALTGLTVISTLPEAPGEPLGGGEIAAAYFALLLLGAVLGWVSDRGLGSRSPLRLSRRRLALLLLWLGTLATTPMFQGLFRAMERELGGLEVALILLLMNYWVAEGLALQPFPPLPRGGWATAGRRFAATLGMSLPILVLVAGGIAVGALAEGTLEGLGLLGIIPGWLRSIAGIGGYLLVAMALVPVLIRVCWRLRRLESPEVERVIEEELQANGVSVARVVHWPEEMMGHATAGVIGLLPRFRYLLFADGLSRSLTTAEIRSVTAHEAAHIKHHHLFFFLAAILTFVLVIQMVLQVLLIGGLWAGFSPPFWATVALELLLLVFFLRYVIGFLSRNFERQADGQALRRVGFADFRSAILKIGHLNGIPIEKDNWHHYGIARRVAYLQEAAEAPERLARHDRTVLFITRICVGGLVLALAAQAVFSETGVVSYFVEKYWLTRLESIREPTEQARQGVEFLASQAFQRGDLPDAERYFRVLLDWNPHDPRIQNNLAWVLVTGPGRDPAALEEGLRLARKAAEVTREAYMWDTLAEAYFRSNRLEAAAAAAAEAMRLAEQGKGRGDVALPYYRRRLADFLKGTTAERG